MHGYCPSRFQRILGKRSDNGLMYLFRLLVKLILHVLPLLWSNINNLRLSDRAHLNVVVINIHDLTNHTVIIFLISRRIVLYEHHLSTQFQGESLFRRE